MSRYHEGESVDRPESGKTEKVPALIAAARRARDDETALLLLQKAKQLDPSCMDVYLLRADIYERRGDEQRELLEYKEALEIDPTNWVVRFRILNLEYPRTRNLKHAAGIIRDLAWQKELPERLFNSTRGALRSESELGHDEALLGHCVLAGRTGYGTVELNAASVLPSGDVFVVNAYEPWLERYEADGTLRYGIDLWLTEDEDLIQGPSDVAAAFDGTAIVTEPRAGRILRFGPDGEYLGTLGSRTLNEPCSAAVAPDGSAYVVCAGDATLRRFDLARGRAVSHRKIAASASALRGGGIAVGPDGTVYLLTGDVVFVIREGAKERSARVKLPRGARQLVAKRDRAQKRGLEFDGSTGTLLIADPPRHAIIRVDLSGREVDRLGGRGALRLPRDVAVDAKGRVTVADSGNARVVQREAGAGDEWRTLVGGAPWRPPK